MSVKKLGPGLLFIDLFIYLSRFSSAFAKSLSVHIKLGLSASRASVKWRNKCPPPHLFLQG